MTFTKKHYKLLRLFNNYLKDGETVFQKMTSKTFQNEIILNEEGVRINFN